MKFTNMTFEEIEDGMIGAAKNLHYCETNPLQKGEIFTCKFILSNFELQHDKCLQHNPTNSYFNFGD